MNTLSVFSRRVGFAFLALLLASARADSPVSGRTLVVDQKHPQASDTGPGSAAQPFQTISRAALLAGPGDTVLVRAGVYREHVAPARGGEEGRPITYTAAPGERVCLRGSELWQPVWAPVAGQPDIMVAPLDAASLFPTEFNPYLAGLRVPRARPIEADSTSWPATRGQVFVDGEPYHEVQSLAELGQGPRSWIVSAEGDAIYVHFTRSGVPPPQRQVELTVRERVFSPHQRNLGYITLRGFVIEHCANPVPAFGRAGMPQIGAVSCRSGHHWVIEQNTIRYAKTVGLDCGSEGSNPDGSTMRPAQAPPAPPPSPGPAPGGPSGSGRSSRPSNVGWHLIRANTVSDNGLVGITGAWHTGTKIIGNIVERNNCIVGAIPENGGIKVHGFTDGLIEGNLVRDNDAWGIWLDAGWTNARVTRNVVLGNYNAGIFVELGTGPCLVDNNVVAFTRHGPGIYSHDASEVTVAHNLVYCNAQQGVFMRVASDRGSRGVDGGRSPVQQSRNRILNNLIVDNYAGAVALPLSWERARDNVCDYNLFTDGQQGQWTTLGAPLFHVDDCEGKIKRETIDVAFAEALKRAGVPAQDQPNLALWAKVPLLTLAHWQLLTGHDTHSQIARLQRFPQVLRARAGELEFIIDDTPWGIECPTVAGVDKDYFGNPLPSSRPLPGPFQNLRQAKPVNGGPPSAAPETSRDPLAERAAASVPGNPQRFLLWPTTRTD